MNKDQAEKRVIKLRALIDDYRYKYHVLDESTMSEAAADSLKHELSELESQFPDLVTPDSPTQKIPGEIAKGFKKVQHASRMLSLNDVFSIDEIDAWVARIQRLKPNEKFKYFADIKLDGLACSLAYENGTLVRGATRGDSFTGEDVTANIKTIESIPLRLEDVARFSSGRTEVRGEIVMFKKAFEKLNTELEKKGQKTYANPRNLAAGTIRQLDPKLVARRPLTFLAYDLIHEGYKATHHEVYQNMAKLGFKTSGAQKTFEKIEDLHKYIEEWREKRDNLDFNTDGFVIKVDDRNTYEELGVIGKAPRGAVAFKYPAEQSTTTVRDIFISIGRTGAATPVAILEPVNLAGSTVSMATLHNASEIEKKDIRVGDTVIVEKAGDIIPAVIEVLTDLRAGSEKKFVFPSICPECSTELVKQREDEAVWRCPNNACPARVSRKIQHFASRAAMDIDGLGEKNVETLLDSGLIKDPADLYSLEYEQILNLERFADVSASKLIESIASKKSPKLAKFIFALGIRQVGTQTAIDLSERFRELENLSSADLEDLLEVEGIGEVVAESILTWFRDPENIELLDKFKKYGVEPVEMEAVSGGELDGISFVITGSLSGMSREEAADRIRELGGTFQSSVGKGTTYLVAGGSVGESKLKKAEQFGTEVIDEARFKELIK